MATVNGSTGNDTLTGTLFADSISANSGNDSVTANGGNDSVYGGAGFDTLFGGSGADLIYGGSEGDQLYGGTENDKLYGDTGADTLFGGFGYDMLYGGDGNDSLVGDNDTYDDFYGGAGNDTIVAGSASDDWAWGGSGNDSIWMGAGDDLAFGGADNDTLEGDLGNDNLSGDGGADKIYGGQGNDFLLGREGADTLDGGIDQDTVFGGFGADSILGGSGNDSLRGDYISGVALTNFPSGAAGPAATWTVVNTSATPVDLYWIDGSGTPIYYGTVAAGGTYVQPTWEGHNWAIYEAGTSNVLDIVRSPGTSTTTIDASFDDSIDGGAGADQIFGDLGNDLIYGGTENDSIYGGVGNDTVFGGMGADYVELGDGDDSFGNFSDEGGNDTIFGGAGNDYIISGGEDDQIYGGTGNDSMSAGVGSDSMYGGSGNDQFYITDDHNFDYIAGGTDWDGIYYSNYISTSGVSVTFSGSDAGTYSYGGTGTSGTFIEIEAIGGTQYADTVNAAADANGTFIDGYGGADLIYGGQGNDTLVGGAGNDTIEYRGGDDLVYGGDGDDVLDDLGGISSTTGNNEVYGGAGNDLIWDGGGDDTMYGDDGNDTIAGDSAGNDLIFGGAGNDSLWGGLGADQIWGGTGSDTIDGGEGQDTIWVSANEGADSILGGSTGTDQDVLSLGGVSSTPVSVTFSGSEAGSYAYTGGGSGTFQDIEAFWLTAGNDTVNGAANTSAMTIDANGGDDVITTGSGNDFVDGDAGNDSITAGAGDDTLSGGDGNDTLTGGDGNDSLTGGSGADTFVLVQGGDADIVTDFDMTLTSGRTADRLDVSALRTPGGDAITWRDVVVTDTVGDGSGDAILTFPSGESVILQGVSAAEVDSKQAMASVGIPCLAKGTPILTPGGWRAVEEVAAGDLVLTRDGAAVTVLWAGGRHLTGDALRADSGLLPVRITRGVLGNSCDLRVSAQHAILMQLGREEVFVRPAHLAKHGYPGVRVARGVRQVSYHHLLLPDHAVLNAGNAALESMYPGPFALSALSRAAQIGVARAIIGQRGVVPVGPLDLAGLCTVYGPRCRRVLSGSEVRKALAHGTLAPVPVAHPQVIRSSRNAFVRLPDGEGGGHPADGLSGPSRALWQGQSPLETAQQQIKTPAAALR